MPRVLCGGSCGRGHGIHSSRLVLAIRSYLSASEHQVHASASLLPGHHRRRAVPLSPFVLCDAHVLVSSLDLLFIVVFTLRQRASSQAKNYRIREIRTRGLHEPVCMTATWRWSLGAAAVLRLLPNIGRGRMLYSPSSSATLTLVLRFGRIVTLECMGNR